MVLNCYYLTVQIIQHVLLDLPGLAFFTTYALLVLFWAEIYYQVCHQFFLSFIQRNIFLFILMFSQLTLTEMDSHAGTINIY